MQPFAGTTLIGHAVDRLRVCRKVDVVCVGSDCDRILDEAERHGAVPVRRDDYHCDESRCSANEMIADMAHKVRDLGDLILWAHPTNPLVRPSTYDAAVVGYGQMAVLGFDSLMSVTPVQRHAWVGGKPWNFDPQAERHQLAADLPAVNFQNGAIFIQPTTAMLANRYFYGRNPYPFEMHPIEAWDIDTPEELDAARALWGVFDAA